MARVKKLTTDEFYELVINKELEIAGASIKYKDIIEDYKKPAEEQKLRRWFIDNKFNTYNQFKEWKQFYKDHFYDWKPKRCAKKEIEGYFAWFNLMYGLAWNFDFPIKDNTDENT